MLGSPWLKCRRNPSPTRSDLATTKVNPTGSFRPPAAKDPPSAPLRPPSSSPIRRWCPSKQTTICQKEANGRQRSSSSSPPSDTPSDWETSGDFRTCVNNTIFSNHLNLNIFHFPSDPKSKTAFILNVVFLFHFRLQEWRR